MARPQKVHMLGIGGAGMAALALMLRDMGMAISGSDREESDAVQRLAAVGIPIDLTESPAALEHKDICVYSAALDKNHPQLQYAKKHMPTFSRGEMMGKVSQDFSTVAAVAGTHGKTTVTGLLTTILLLDGKDPSALIGGYLPAMGGNGRLGGKEFLVCEACEFAGSFLHLKRDMGILLNIDNDHLECYGSMKKLCNTFTLFFSSCRTVVVCGEDQNAMDATENHPHRICYGYGEDMDCRATNLKETRGFYTFTLHLKNKTLENITLKIPGKHNVLNASAAAAAAQLLGASESAIKKGLAAFGGVARRFEVICKERDITVADDYAHHPAEIAAVLTGAKNMGFSRIIAVFQPFTYSRTLALHKEFAHALSAADEVILSPIMGGREPDDGTVTTNLISQHLGNVTVCDSLSACAHAALQNAEKGTLILTMGCGNVYRCAREIAEGLKKWYDSGKTA